MSGRAIPAAVLRVAHEDVSVDQLCFEQALQALGNRRDAGLAIGYVEATLAANPGLAAAGPFLPLGMTVSMPLFTIAENNDLVVRLWDDAP